MMIINQVRWVDVAIFAQHRDNWDKNNRDRRRGNGQLLWWTKYKSIVEQDRPIAWRKHTLTKICMDIFDNHYKELRWMVWIVWGKRPVWVIDDDYIHIQNYDIIKRLLGQTQLKTSPKWTETAMVPWYWIYLPAKNFMIATPHCDVHADRNFFDHTHPRTEIYWSNVVCNTLNIFSLANSVATLNQKTQNPQHPCGGVVYMCGVGLDACVANDHNGTTHTENKFEIRGCGVNVAKYANDMGEWSGGGNWEENHLMNGIAVLWACCGLVVVGRILASNEAMKPNCSHHHRGNNCGETSIIKGAGKKKKKRKGEWIGLRTKSCWGPSTQAFDLGKYWVKRSWIHTLNLLRRMKWMPECKRF